ncbi:MAG TPA: hypothetical protein VMR96_07800 [Solirubrobacterales bacterium]|nr:hypothetical protein [Solirubrobacterales bacterium]
MTKIRTHITYANVTATLALFIALGMGSAYAAQQLAPKSVGAKQLRPGAVTADKVRKQAITAPKIESLAIKQGKIAAGAVSEAKLANAAVSTAKLASGAVTGEKVAPDSLGGASINESTLGTVRNAAHADIASFADASNPEAFAKVDGEATVLPGSSKGIGTADVKKGPEDGVYCINVPGFTPRGAQVTPEFTFSGSVHGFVKLGPTTGCPNAKIEVQMRAPGLVKSPFFIVVFR